MAAVKAVGTITIFVRARPVKLHLLLLRNRLLRDDLSKTLEAGCLQP